MPYNPPSGNTTGNTNGAEDSNALEARLKKLRDGLWEKEMKFWNK